MKRQMSTPLCRKLRHHRSYKFCALALSAAFLLGACGQSVQGNVGMSAAGTEEAQAAESGSTEQTNAASRSGTAEGERLAEAFFSERDYRTEYDASSAVKISFEGSSVGSSDEKAAVVSGSTVTITDEGCYILSGNLTDGRLIIDAEKSDKIQLVLNGVTLCSESSAAIYVKQADKVFLTTAEGTENTLSNGGSYTAIDENAIDAVIFSKDDLTLNGEGKLTIRAEAGHGIVSKDSLAVTSGAYEITAAEDGMSGKDGVDITESEEGIEGATIDVLDGEVSIVSRDEQDGAGECCCTGTGCAPVGTADRRRGFRGTPLGQCGERAGQEAAAKWRSAAGEGRKSRYGRAGAAALFRGGGGCIHLNLRRNDPHCRLR